MHIGKRLALFFLPVILCSCWDDSSPDISDINVPFNVVRFEREFYGKEKDLNVLKDEYSFMFPNNIPDSIWNKKINDSNELDIFNKCELKFSNFSNQKKKLEQLFKHIKFYYPKFTAPDVYTYISKIDIEYPVIYADSLLFISIDLYLGNKSSLYNDIPEYIKDNFDKKYLIVDAANSIAKKIVPISDETTFISEIIYRGKLLFFIKKILPETTIYDIFKYSKSKMEWLKKNEWNIWKYFIQKKILYSTDKHLLKRFVLQAPFSKFFLNIDKESPDRVGVYIGYKIFEQYVKNNPDKTWQELLNNTSSTEIMSLSKYKPNK
ncbi:gliding motility lipoprotein GldB [Ichthyobacterium seriolicida]|uniref:Gliding motility protein GldB n=1 Tax=Ichthyobacterium seriolicida TaxID=242600 RepID=A0A1J1DYI4_9FLAO|nr:gliding motility lipoprotein GldB [Ichthyobacterium seriolicida]BAV94937.1 gliding motility protein GldB [Ichthyobacterium seriolicida]